MRMGFASLMVALLAVGCGGGNGGGGNGGGNVDMARASSGGGSVDMARAASGGGSVDMAGGMIAGGPVSLKNTAIRMVSGDRFNVTFAVEDNVWKNDSSRDIMRIDDVRFAWGQQMTSANVACSSSPWTGARPLSTAITIELDYSLPTDSTTIVVPCDDGTGTTSRLPGTGSQTVAPSGSVHVVIAGILRDATTFTAEADAVVQ